MFSIKLNKILTVISSNFFLSHSHNLLGLLLHMHLDHLILSHKFLMLCSVFFNSFFSLFLELVIARVLSSLWTLSSAISNLLSPFYDFFIVVMEIFSPRIFIFLSPLVLFGSF